MTDLFKAAKTYIKPNGMRHALKVFPIKPNDKIPATSHGLKDASNNVKQIEKWWKAAENANIGIPTGEVNGIIVIDVDTDPDKGIDGAEGLQDLEKRLGKLPDTWEAITGRGGRHLVFKYPTGHDIRNSVSKIAEGVDIRANGGYIVAPPSIHPNGNEYQWEASSYPHEVELATLPAEWVAILETSKTDQSKGFIVSSADTFNLPNKIPNGQRNGTLFKYAASMRARAVPASDILKQLNQANAERCITPIEGTELGRIFDSVMKFKEGSDAAQMKPATPGTTQSFKPSDLSDAGNAVSFFRMFTGSLLWCDALGWLVWDGVRWDVNSHAATNKAIQFSEYLLKDAFNGYRGSQKLDEAGKITVTEEANAYLKHAKKTRSRSYIQNAMELSKTWFAIKAAELDINPFLLNTPGGVYNLKTGEIQPNKSDLYCTHLTTSTPGKQGADIWQSFLDLITEGDKELQTYLQVAMGSCMIGKVMHEGIWVAIGGGRNGKSTFFNVISKVIGDYSGSIDSTILTTDKQNRGASLATLRGKRLVTCGELEEGQRLSVQTLKKLAATDELTIEEKYKSPESITPSHHICIFSNFLPRVGSTDNGTWRRLKVIPFNATMPEGDADIPNYAEVLLNDAGASILQWVIDGAKTFSANSYHLPRCHAVEASTADYRGREDWLQLFISERCIVDRGIKIRCGELYNTYKAYASETGDYCRRLADFNAAMETAGFKQISEGGNRKYWFGIHLEPVSAFSHTS